MSRAPADQIAKNAQPYGQDGIWAQIRRLNIFTVSEIAETTGTPRRTVSSYVSRLEAGGYVDRRADFEDSKRYELIRDAGVHAPQVKKDGSPVTQGGGTANMWRSMRILKDFSPVDLAAHSNTETVAVSEASAKAYCKMLLAANYLRCTQKAVPGKRPAVYMLLRNTGPRAPQIQRVKRVFDPNLNKVAFVAEPGQ